MAKTARRNAGLRKNGPAFGLRAHLPERFSCDFSVDDLPGGYESIHQGTITQSVDDPGNPLGELPDLPDSLRFKDARAAASDHLQSMVDLFEAFLLAERVDAVTGGDPVLEGLQFDRVQFGLEFRLADQENLDQLG
jgi:hypothetical protein